MASGRRLLTAAATLLSAAAAAGCVSMSSSGQPQQYLPNQGTGVSQQQYLQVYSEPPGANWSPKRIVEGFLAANASFAADHQVARQYLTTQASSKWGHTWSADVFTSAPEVALGAQSGRTAIVTVKGQLQASVTDEGTYAAPGTTSASAASRKITIKLTKTSGQQWRISTAPPRLLLSASDFQATYQQRDLYFFDPHLKHLVADPVYVPVAAARAEPEILLSELVNDLINRPANDWLSHATSTMFPHGTSLLNVTLAGGVATVYLKGAAIGRASNSAYERIAAQLLWTLVGSADSQPVITGVELTTNGKPWIPPGPSANPIIQKTEPAYARYAPPTGQKSDFYYLDGKGNVWRRAGPSVAAKIILRASAKGPHLSAVAVSPDEKYLAGLANGTIYTAPVSGRLQFRDSGGFTSLSWDPSDNLWAAGTSGVVMLPAAGGAPEMVSVAFPNTITAVRVAPDGVRVALVVAGTTTIEFAAIQTTGNAIFIDTPSPFSVSGSGISDVTWYGPDNVIALSGTGPQAQATEYPVNGGTPIQVPQQAGMTNITASWGNALIASTVGGELLYTETIGGAWVPLGSTGNSAVYPG